MIFQFLEGRIILMGNRIAFMKRFVYLVSRERERGHYATQVNINTWLLQGPVSHFTYFNCRHLEKAQESVCCPRLDHWVHWHVCAHLHQPLHHRKPKPKPHCGLQPAVRPHAGDPGVVAGCLSGGCWCDVWECSTHLLFSSFFILSFILFLFSLQILISMAYLILCRDFLQSLYPAFFRFFPLSVFFSYVVHLYIIIFFFFFPFLLSSLPFPFLWCLYFWFTSFITYFIDLSGNQALTWPYPNKRKRKKREKKYLFLNNKGCLGIFWWRLCTKNVYLVSLLFFIICFSIFIIM